MLGARLLKIARQSIRTYGEALVFTRRPGTQGGTATTQTIYCLPEPLAPEVAAQFNLEGIGNVSEQFPHDFAVAGDADVREGDLVTYDGWIWRIAAAQPNPVGGVRVVRHCVGLRERSA